MVRIKLFAGGEVGINLAYVVKAELNVNGRMEIFVNDTPSNYETIYTSFEELSGAFSDRI